MCTFTWMWRSGTQLYTTSTRLVYMCYRGDSLLLVAQQWTIASSAARWRYRPSEGESTNDVGCCRSRRRAAFKLIEHRQKETARYLSMTLFGRRSIHWLRVQSIQLIVPFFFALAERNAVEMERLVCLMRAWYANDAYNSATECSEWPVMFPCFPMLKYRVYQINLCIWKSR